MDIFRVLSKAKFDPTFICDTPSSIASDFWSWWVSRNLPARTRADNGWLVPGSGNDPVEISKLQVPGKNGWLSLLFILMIWRHSISTGDTTKWDLAVIDINWVTHRLIDSIWYRPSIEDIPTLKRWVLPLCACLLTVYLCIHYCISCRMYTMTGADEEGGHRK